MDIGIFVNSLKTFLSRNVPAILTAMGAVGVVGTAVLAVKATPEAMEKYEELEEELGSDLETIDVVKGLWRIYLPSVVSGATSIFAIVGSHSVHGRRGAAVMSAYSLLEKAYNEYREELIEQDGPNKDRKIRDSVAKKVLIENPSNPGNQVFISGNGDTLCYDSISGRYFNSTIEKIRKAQNDVNAKIISDMYASHNDFYKEIGLEPTTLGEELGWTTDNMLDLNFSSHLSEDGRPALYLDYIVSPKRNYYKVY